MLRLALSGAILLILATSAPVLAGGDGACPATPSGWFRVTIDQWWDRSVEGWAEEGITVYEPGGGYTAQFDAWAQSQGFADGAAIEAYVRGPQWLTIDRDGNGYGCMRDMPNTKGSPGWIFGGIDDRAAG